MKKKKLLISSLLFLTLLVSCVSKSPYIVDHPKFTEDGAPYWTVLTPISKDRFYGVGSGNLSTVQNSKIRAEAVAKDEIARQVSTIVQGAVNNYINENKLDTKVYDVFESFSTQVTNITLRNVIIENNWKDPKTGTIWVIASYEKSNLKEAYQLESKNLERTLEKRKIAALEEIAKLEIKNDEQKKLNESDVAALEALSQAYDTVLNQKQKVLDAAVSAIDSVNASALLNSYDEEFARYQNSL